MLNEEKVRLMNKLALYEKTEGKKYLPVSKYYRSDYIGLALIRNFFLVTFSYGLVAGAVAAYYGDYLLENIHKMDLFQLGVDVAAAYIIVLLGYSVFTYILYTVKYMRAKKSVRGYYQDLTRLEKMYSREERKTAGRRPRGRR